MAAMLEAKDSDGNAKVDERKAQELLAELSDVEIEDGILFNTPEEVAEVLLGSGL